MAANPPPAEPLFTVFQAQDAPKTCFRAVANNPAQVGDFVSYVDMGSPYKVADHIYAIGVSTFDTMRAAVAATRGRLPFVAQLEIGHDQGADVKWAYTRGGGHITLWAHPADLLDCVVVTTDKYGNR